MKIIGMTPLPKKYRRKPKRDPEADKAFIRNNCQRMSDQQMASKLGRPVKWVATMRTRMGLIGIRNST